MTQLPLNLFESLLLVTEAVERERAVLAYGAEALERHLGFGVAGVAAGDGLYHLQARVQFARVLVGLAPDAFEPQAVFVQILFKLGAPGGL